ncbi:MAG: S-methyl-5-thioribose-1-phosphate isomerase [Deltaproteobacteria bacterium]|nr:S-methyl-5-thioribose-1-phosphate isomerase [Deltaproteobacteria bacterium]
MQIIKTIQWKDDKVIMIDQRRLPLQEIYNAYEDYKGVADAIKHMVIRGAPAIGVAAAMGVALGSLGIGVKTFDEFYKRILRICETLEATRPTAVNLAWATNRMKAVCLLHKDLPIEQLKQRLKEEAMQIQREDIDSCKKIGGFGHVFLENGDSVLTHCNAGSLATAGAGTALGVLYAASAEGKVLTVYADETRPLLQGARLTAWELQKHGMNVTVITDNMAGALMKDGLIKKVIVGADRIAANGDIANKIGTYTVAVLASRHKIPFYVAAPTSTIDLTKKNGSEIPIEERDSKEVTHVLQHQITPDYVNIRNPSFDVTPAELVTAIITEKGVAEPPFGKNLKILMG